nr:MAG TPA: hypothetical protein [Caudoviricetes sp.]
MLAIRNGQEPPPLPDSLKYVMAHIQNFWSEQDQKYQEKVVDRNKENGKKGGRPPKQKPQKPLLILLLILVILYLAVEKIPLTRY